MSWEVHRVESKKCLCGRGKIVRQSLSDDWNRYEDNVYLECEFCEKEYHIESLSVGYGIENHNVYYLVKNGETIQNPHRSSGCFAEDIIYSFRLMEIKEALVELEKNKYASRVQGITANSIIRIHKRRYGTVKLDKIVPRIKKIIIEYPTYEWNREKYEEEKAKRDKYERIPV